MYAVVFVCFLNSTKPQLPTCSQLSITNSVKLEQNNPNAVQNLTKKPYKLKETNMKTVLETNNSKSNINYFEIFNAQKETK